VRQVYWARALSSSLQVVEPGTSRKIPTASSPDMTMLSSKPGGARVPSVPIAVRVLVIEDEPRLLAFVRHALEAEGLVVEAAADGAAGLEAALRGGHDLVVLDLVLPGLSGLTVLERLRDARPDLPVLILSARAELPTKLRGFALGATDYVTKPFSLDEFLARVRVQLRRGGRDSVLSVGPLALDLISRQVYLGDGMTDLSEREFGLLRALMEQPGTVVPREQLLSVVWGIDFDPGTNVVDVCVRRLRRKLGPAARIETVRNAGYRIRAE
jgi:two-component system copper resistance phosphate regulon response regulator CusR